MRLLLLKSAKFANQAGYYLHQGRWHKVSDTKPAPKGAPVSAHPHAAGAPVKAETLADHEWSQLQLPAENVNAKTFNKQLDQLKAAASAGDVTGIVASGYGTNTYGKKLTIIANHVLGLLGSDHKVTPGQKAGAHAAVQTAPEIEAAAPEPKAENPAEAKQEPAAPQEAKPDQTLAVPAFSEGVKAKGVKAHYEKVAKKVIRAAKAGDLSALQFMVNPEKGNTWKGKTDNSKALLALHAQAVEHAQGVKGPGKDIQHPNAEKNAATEAKELAKEKVTPEQKAEPAPTPEPKPEPKPAPAKPEPAKPAAEAKPSAPAGVAANLSQIPWDGMLLPDSNKNAKSHNKQVAKIKAMAEAGDIEGLKAFKAGTNTYGKKQNLLAQTALAALEEGSAEPAPTAEAKPVEKPTRAEKKPEASKASTDGIPQPPKITDFNTNHVANIWKNMASEGKVPELMASINTLAQNAQKTPKSFTSDDAQALLGYAKEMAKWVSATAKSEPAVEAKPIDKPARAEKKPDPVAEATPATSGPIEDPNSDEVIEVMQGWKKAIAEGKAPSKAQAQVAEQLKEDHPMTFMEWVVEAEYDLDEDHDGTDDHAAGELNAKIMALHNEGLHGSSEAGQDDGPQEGATKQGADGMLVFQNGRWHKMGDDGAPADKAAAAAPAPSGPGDVGIPEFTAPSATHNEWLAKAAQALKEKVAEHGKAGFKGVLTNHKNGSVTVNIAGVKIGKASVSSKNPGVAQFAQFVDELKASVSAQKTAKPKPKPTQQAPAAGPVSEPAQPQPVESMDSWTQTGGQGGSNPGGKFKDENGVEWYCKFPADEHIAKAEVLAAKLYGALGLNAQDAKLVTKDGKVGIASKWQNVTKATPKELAATPGVLEGFAADAWLANWDVVGMAYDNLQVGDGGHAMRVDAGGSLMYRAQGSKKAFGDTVTELDTLRDAKLNPQAAAVFGGMSQADITASVAKVAQITDAQIRILVNANGPGDKAERKALAETLIARKNDLIAKYPKAVKVKKKRLDPSNLPVKEERLPKAHDFANWKGPGSGLSSKDIVNKANQQVEDEMLAIAKTGNLTKLKEFKFRPVSISTGQPFGNQLPIVQHPSKHVQQFHQDLIQALDEVANPPQPLKIFQESDLNTLDELEMAFPSKKFGTTVNTVHSNEKMGFWVVLGGVHKAAEKFMPKSISHFTTSAIEGAYAKYKEASKLAKHYINSIQASGSYNDLFREGKEFDGAGNKLSDVAKAALEYATEQPEGTTVYRWQQMTKDMIDKIMSAPDGTVFQATGPMCTSMSPTATSHFGPHRIKISYAKGAKAVESFGSGNFQGEKEVTTLPNSRFVILKKEMVPSGSGKRMELEVLMLPPDLGL